MLIHKKLNLFHFGLMLPFNCCIHLIFTPNHHIVSQQQNPPYVLEVSCKCALDQVHSQ